MATEFEINPNAKKKFIAKGFFKSGTLDFSMPTILSKDCILSGVKKEDLELLKYWNGENEATDEGIKYFGNDTYFDFDMENLSDNIRFLSKEEIEAKGLDPDFKYVMAPDGLSDEGYHVAAYHKGNLLINEFQTLCWEISEEEINELKQMDLNDEIDFVGYYSCRDDMPIDLDDSVTNTGTCHACVISEEEYNSRPNDHRSLCAEEDEQNYYIATDNPDSEGNFGLMMYVMHTTVGKILNSPNEGRVVVSQCRNVIDDYGYYY